MITVAFSHKHMTVMHMVSTLPVFKLDSLEMVTLGVSRNSRTITYQPQY